MRGCEQGPRQIKHWGKLDLSRETTTDSTVITRVIALRVPIILTCSLRASPTTAHRCIASMSAPVKAEVEVAMARVLVARFRGKLDRESNTVHHGRWCARKKRRVGSSMEVVMDDKLSFFCFFTLAPSLPEST